MRSVPRRTRQSPGRCRREISRVREYFRDPDAVNKGNSSSGTDLAKRWLSEEPADVFDARRESIVRQTVEENLPVPLPGDAIALTVMVADPMDGRLGISTSKPDAVKVTSPAVEVTLVIVSHAGNPSSLTTTPEAVEGPLLVATRV